MSIWVHYLIILNIICILVTITMSSSEYSPCIWFRRVNTQAGSTTFVDPNDLMFLHSDHRECALVYANCHVEHCPLRLGIGVNSIAQ